MKVGEHLFQVPLAALQRIGVVLLRFNLSLVVDVARRVVGVVGVGETVSGLHRSLQGQLPPTGIVVFGQTRVALDQSEIDYSGSSETRVH